MNVLTPVSDKIVPLVARLGSDSDGERLACLRQLDKVLGRAGVSWTDLAMRLSAVRETSCCAGTRTPRPAHPATDEDRLGFVLRLDRSLLSDREFDFIANLQSNGAFWRGDRPDTLRSEKQAKWLRDIYSRVAREGGYV